MVSIHTFGGGGGGCGVQVSSSSTSIRKSSGYLGKNWGGVEAASVSVM